MAFETSSLNKTTVIFAAVGFVTFAVAMSMFKRRRNYVKNVAKVTKLIFYPIKSLQGIEVDELQLTTSGAHYGQFRDRSFILLDADNRMITQRQEPTLTLLKPRIIGPRELLVEVAGRDPLKVTLAKSVEKDDTVRDFKIWGSATQGVHCGEEASRWFCDYLGKSGVRLVQHVDELLMRPSSYEKGTKLITDYKNKIRFQDGCPVMLINSASIRDLNGKLPSNRKPTDHRYWRPNILIDETNAYSEDNWQYIKIGDAELWNSKPCTRCMVTTIDPDNPKKDRELLEIYSKIRAATDERQRKLYGDEPLFGVNYNLYNKNSKISVGDAIDAIDF